MKDSGNDRARAYTPPLIVPNATDPTPTLIEWRIENDVEPPGYLLIGIEKPANTDHSDRVAGKMILDNGKWRELAYVVMELPDTVEAAMSIRYEPAR